MLIMKFSFQSLRIVTWLMDMLEEGSNKPENQARYFGTSIKMLASKVIYQHLKFLARILEASHVSEVAPSGYPVICTIPLKD